MYLMFVHHLHIYKVYTISIIAFFLNLVTFFNKMTNLNIFIQTAMIDKKEKYMRIAVTYDNGNVFQHFGHTEEFMVYTTEDNKIINKEIVSSNELGHSALAYLLEENKINVLICGGIGGCAIGALREYGIELFAGITGSTDKAVEDYLAGNLVQVSEANCSHHGDHHHEGEHSCGHCH